jgi:heat shock protein HslJ
MTTSRVPVLLAALALAATGCGDETAGPRSVPPSDTTLSGRSFVSTQVTAGGQPKALVPGTRIQVTFHSDRRVTVTAGCNHLGLTMAPSGTSFAGDGVSMTEMGCDKPRHAQDSWLAEFLGAAPALRIKGDTLTLGNADTTITLLDRRVAEPAKPLAGTTWRLSGEVSGDTASSSAGASKAYLRFAAGKVTGSTGCNDLSGTAAVTGDRIAFAGIGLTRRACAGEQARIEQLLQRTLTGTLTYQIESDALRLRAADGNGIDLTAA